MMNNSYQIPRRAPSDSPLIEAFAASLPDQEESKVINAGAYNQVVVTPNTSQQNCSYYSSGASGDSDGSSDEGDDSDDDDEGYFDQDGIGLYRTGKSM